MKISDRTERMVSLYVSGQTLQQIGDEYGLTRERVRQLIRPYIARDCGGSSARKMVAIRASAEKNKQVKADRIARIWNMTLDDYLSHIDEWGTTTQRGSPMERYIRQRNSARKRGIEWRFTFPQWWAAWQESGKWAQRGRGAGYCMARHGDSGPYSPENVYICTIGENFSHSYLVHPWHERFRREAQERR